MEYSRTILTLLLACFVVVAAMVWHLSWLQSGLMESAALRTTELYSTALTQFRTRYMSEVVEKARKNGLKATHDFLTRDDAIPLPATLSMLLDRDIGQSGSRVSSYLYSPYPFPGKQKQTNGLHGEFHQKAWAFLSVNPDKAYYQFSGEGADTILHYATADLMRPACVACHNSHPDSPKTDWKPGDLRGVLEVSLPLDVIASHASNDLRTSKIAYLIAGLGVVLIIGMVIVRLDRQAEKLEKRVSERTSDLESEIAMRRKMEERFRLAIDASPVAMIMVNEAGDILHVNRESESLFGYLPGELVGKAIATLLPANKDMTHPPYRDIYFSGPLARKMRGRDFFARKADGDTFPIQVGLNSIDTRDGVIVLYSVEDLSAQKEFEESVIEQTQRLKKSNDRLYREATVDSLTNVANRRCLDPQLDTLLQLARRNGQPVSVLMADIDNFKQYNDDFGHPAGDQALKSVAKKLDEVNRQVDFVARYGGEEFAILLPDTDQRGALEAGEKFRKSVEAISDLDRKITMSFGVATISINRGKPFEVEKIRARLIKHADEALYASKRSGKNRVTHYLEIAYGLAVVDLKSDKFQGQDADPVN